ncbi:protein translocase subunit SecDF [Mycoplasma sp. CSL10166]|uniref:protein translocase subunit SecDF n=1 Tax=Mycoplasma sp. CSL10166 TaxID=2813825 RepID=UPI00197C58FF|nr:protein translocase subunit SecDF [Mycoplasma sp. CSL10166]MBN4084533.1 protein translocase subunit SecDF [Mycoplasma sp. CSL10166]
MKYIKKLLSINNWKRFILNITTILIALLTIVFGSVFYIGKNVNKSIEYGGGIEVLIQVKQDGANANNELTEEVNKSLFNRLTGGTGLNGVSVYSEGDGKIRITKSGRISESDRIAFEKAIVEKPILTITDSDIKPLFYDGVFNRNGSLEDGTPQNWIPPFKVDGASYVPNPTTGGSDVSITLDGIDAQKQWADATEYATKRADQLLLIWLDIDKLLTIAKNNYPDEWKKSGENLWNFVHVNEELKDKEGKANQIKEFILNIRQKYLISVAQVNYQINGDKVSITGNFTRDSAIDLANKINFGLSKYDLSVLSSIYVDANLNSNSFFYAMIAGIIIFSMISIFMIVNYGLLGSLSTIAMALYIFLTLLIFTALRGEYSPATLAALIIGIGISVDANVITYERLKQQVYSGDTLKKSFKNSSRSSLTSIIDANMTTIIVGFILFYFGTKDVKGFSITLVLSTLFTLFSMLVFSKFIATLMVNTGIFDNRLWLLGISKKKIGKTTNFNSKVAKFNYIKQSKWFALSSFIFLIIAAIVFGAFAGFNISFWDGVNRSIEFSGGINITIQGDFEKNTNLNYKQAQEISNSLINSATNLGINDAGDIIKINGLNSNDNYVVLIRTKQDLTNQFQSIKDFVLNINDDVLVTNYSVSYSEATKLVQNALIATGISFIGIIIYMLIRMNWTFAIAAIIGLIHDFLVVLAFIFITRIQVNTIIVAAMLSILGLSINDTIVTFDKIRETVKVKYHKQFLSKEDIINIANSSIGEILKRSLYTSFTTMFAVAVLLAFINATDFSFNIIMLFGIGIGVYSSIFIATWIWTILETKRQQILKRRKETGYWKINKPEEQTFNGINDYI